MAENRTPAPGAEDGPEPDAFARSLDMDAATYRELQAAFKAVDADKGPKDADPEPPAARLRRSFREQFMDGWRQSKDRSSAAGEKRRVLIAHVDATSVWGHTMAIQVVDLTCRCEKACPPLRVLVIDQGPRARFVTPLASSAALAEQIARLVLAYGDEGPADLSTITG